MYKTLRKSGLSRSHAEIFMILFVLLIVYGGTKPSYKNLTLHTPIEDAGGVRFSWAGGEIGQRYSIWGRIEGTDTWEEIERNLPPDGSFYLPGFKLRDNWQYRIQITEEATEGGAQSQYMYFNSSKINWLNRFDYDQNKRDAKMVVQNVSGIQWPTNMPSMAQTKTETR